MNSRKAVSVENNDSARRVGQGRRREALGDQLRKKYAELIGAAEIFHS
jgi:hypothetical protein